MGYLINSKLQPGATPYSVPNRITGSATIDTTAILLEELDRLGEPLPIAIATHGFSRIADDVARVLDERGQSRYSAAQWRSALLEVFKRLTDSKGDASRRSPNLASTKKDNQMTSNEPSTNSVSRVLRSLNTVHEPADAASVRLAARANEILTAQAVFDPTPQEYMSAIAEARAELDEPDEQEASQGIGHDAGLELHVKATQILRARGIYKEDETLELYESALDEAATAGGISLTGRSA
jgi:hypothetical protein